jgi:hypothetical protein
MKKTKKDIIEYIYKECKKNENYVFNNEYVKDVLKKLNSKTNPYDITKLDDTSKYPKSLLNDNMALIHLGDGKHKFVPYLDNFIQNLKRLIKAKK